MSSPQQERKGNSAPSQSSKTKVNGGCKRGSKKPGQCQSVQEPKSSLLDVLKNKDCDCEMMARAVRSGVYMHMGGILGPVTPPKILDTPPKPTDEDNEEDGP